MSTKDSNLIRAEILTQDSQENSMDELNLIKVKN